VPNGHRYFPVRSTDPAIWHDPGGRSGRYSS